MLLGSLLFFFFLGNTLQFVYFYQGKRQMTQYILVYKSSFFLKFQLPVLKEIYSNMLFTGTSEIKFNTNTYVIHSNVVLERKGTK